MWGRTKEEMNKAKLPAQPEVLNRAESWLECLSYFPKTVEKSVM